MHTCSCLIMVSPVTGSFTLVQTPSEAKSAIMYKSTLNSLMAQFKINKSISHHIKIYRLFNI